MKKYQLWGFNYLTRNRDKETNIITGTNDESEDELIVPCFDGTAFFHVNGKYYIAKYPKMRKLNEYYRDKIKDYCGYYPNGGEYGIVMGALGIIIECDYKAFCNYFYEYIPSLTKKDKRQIDWIYCQ